MAAAPAKTAPRMPLHHRHHCRRRCRRRIAIKSHPLTVTVADHGLDRIRDLEATGIVLGVDRTHDPSRAGNSRAHRPPTDRTDTTKQVATLIRRAATTINTHHQMETVRRRLRRGVTNRDRDLDPDPDPDPTIESTSVDLEAKQIQKKRSSKTSSNFCS